MIPEPSGPSAKAISEPCCAGRLRDDPCPAAGSNPGDSGTRAPRGPRLRARPVLESSAPALRWRRVAVRGICAALLALPPAAAQTVDCVAERVAVQQERNLLRKRDLLDRALALCPQDPQIRFEKGFSEERLRNYAQALEHYSVAVEIDETYARAHFGRADVLMILEDYRSAIEAYEAGLKLNPDHTRALAALRKARTSYRPPAAPMPPPHPGEPPAPTNEPQ